MKNIIDLTPTFLVVLRIVGPAKPGAEAKVGELDVAVSVD